MSPWQTESRNGKIPLFNYFSQKTSNQQFELLLRPTLVGGFLKEEIFSQLRETFQWSKNQSENSWNLRQKCSFEISFIFCFIIVTILFSETFFCDAKENNIVESISQH